VIFEIGRRVARNGKARTRKKNWNVRIVMNDFLKDWDGTGGYGRTTRAEEASFAKDIS
jgi:hypothetical protein